ncbi:MAG TPA: hypothetical protein VHX44_20130 [Planctomycetota bacterium]|jgi:hypothetical protein|nr:hypothetical protein [Planctomycetota bacterium]
MKALLLLLLVAGLPAVDLPAMELGMPVQAYWRLRGLPAAEAEHLDLTIHRIGSVTVDNQSVTLFYYRYGISGDDDGGQQRERELLLVMKDQHLHGWYQITGTEKAFALAQILNQEVVLPDGFHRPVWPLPTVLSETTTVDGKEESQSYLLHLAPAP